MTQNDAENPKNAEGMSVGRAREMVAAMPEGLHFIDMAGTVYEGLCAVAGEGWETMTGPDLIARLPEAEDGSDPCWKLLQHAPDLARLVLRQAAELERLGNLRTAVSKLLSIHDEFAQFDAQDELAGADPDGETPYSSDDDRVEVGERLDVAERDLRAALASAEAGDQA